MPHRLVAAAVCLLVLVWHVPAGLAQQQTPQRPFGTAVEQWDRAFNAIALEIDRGEIAPARGEALKETLAGIDAEAKEIRRSAQGALGPLKVQIEALGPAPAEGEPPEAAEIAAQRQKIGQDIADYEARIKQADLAATKVADLTAQINALALKGSLQRLVQVYPIPVAPNTIAEAVPEYVKLLAVMSHAPAQWWRSLSAGQQQIVLTRIAVFLIPAVIVAWVLRRALLRFFGRNPTIQNPTYARRLTGAVAEGLAHGIVPSFILAAILVRAQSDATLMSGLFAEMVVAASGVAIMITLAWALPRAVLAPDLPSWRVLPVTAEHARIISRRIVYLAAIFGTGLFFYHATAGLSVSDSLFSLFNFVVKTLEAAGIFALLPRGLWTWEEEPDEPAPPEGEAAEKRAGSRLWATLRRLSLLIALASVASALAGYANLSRYLIDSLVISGMTVGVLYLLRGSLRELIGVALRSRVMQVQLAIPHKTRQRYKFWLRAILDTAINVAGAILLLIVWGVPAEDIYDWSRDILREFTIGNVTISLTDIFVAVLIFVVAMTVTRAIQRALTDRVFPQTNLDVGVQNSLSSGLGYVGLAIAAMLAISAIGLDLSNIALIAGALSVGIGFGLQAIINNFVSGLILLIERPIKVGDWIIVGAYEGTVKRINVRATEIETFQRASIIVPNSEMITGAVTNWTHKDSYGRVEIPVGVAYGSDVQKVMSVLNDCLRANQDILPWPEPQVLFRAFGDSSLNFEARGFIGDVTRRIQVVSALCVAIDQAFREADIEIPFPQRDLHIRSAAGLTAAERQAMASAGGAPGAEPGTEKK